VENATLVRGVETRRNAACHLEGLARGNGSASDPFRQRLALDVLHDEEIDATVGPDVVQSTDVLILNRGDGARFALEALARLGRVGQVRRQHLDGDRAIEARIAGAVNLADPADPDERGDFIRPETGSGGERHLQDSARTS
jgi:hypothetical protein